MSGKQDLFGKGHNGSDLWSDATNWDVGIPLDGDSVVLDALPANDDLNALSVADLNFNPSPGGTAIELTVTGQSLTVGTLTATTPNSSALDATAVAGPVNVTIDALEAEGTAIFSTGAGARVVVGTAVSQAESFFVRGGEIEIVGTPSSNWSFGYDGTRLGTIAFDHPAASNGMPLQAISVGDVLELPGVSVSNVTFGSGSISVSTSAGVYAFTDVTYNQMPRSYSAAVDPVTGLVAITFADQDLFTPSTTATSGPLSGDYVWSNTLNWTGGVPVNGDVVSAGATGYDDIAALQLSSLTLNEAGAAAKVFVTGAALTIADLEQSGAGGSGMLEADAADAGKPVTLTLQHSGVSSATFEAKGAGSKLLDQAATDTASNTYAVENGGLVELSNTPYSGDIFSFTSSGTFAFNHPGAVVSSLMLGVSIGDTIEVPGTTVSNVSLGSGSVAITTDAGTYDFSAVTYSPSSQIEGYTATVDPVTGLEAITFAGPDKLHYKAAGTYWSDPTVWSRGLPINGDNVVNAQPGSFDDIPVLSLNSLNLSVSPNFGTAVYVTGTLAIGTLYSLGDEVVAGIATAAAHDGPPATVTIGAIVSTTPGFIGLVSDLAAAGTHATLIDNAPSDPGTDYAVYYGGTVEITAATPSVYSHLEYNSSLGTFAIWHPAATNAMFVNDPIPGDVLELPGTSVSGVTFGSSSLSVTTDVGTYSFSNVRYVAAEPITGYAAALDPTTGLVAITFTGSDTFRDANIAAGAGNIPNYLWSDSANWTDGVPINGDNVTVPTATVYGASSIDNLPSLHLASLALGAVVSVGGGATGADPTTPVSLTVDTLVASAGGVLEVEAGEPGVATTVTVGAISGAGNAYDSAGLGSRLVIQGGTDQGNYYDAANQGFIELPGTVADASTLVFQDSTIALKNPAAVTNAAITDLRINYDDGYAPMPPDVLELPGTSVLSLAIGAHSLDIVTDVGHYSFTNVTGGGAGQPINDDGIFSITGYTAALDPTTGLVAITFTGPDVFLEKVKSTSGPLAGKYLWSNAANWSNGVPVDGSHVVVADQAAIGYDDLATLKLSSLGLNGSDVFVTGGSLTVDAVMAGGHTAADGTLYGGTLHADALVAGAPVTVTVGTITDSYAPFPDQYLAEGTGARFVDQSTVDASENYSAYSGGIVDVEAAPASTSHFYYSGDGAFAFQNPGASITALLAGVAPGDVLELPGTSVSAVTFGAHSLGVTTDAGSYSFTNVSFVTPVTGYTAAFDPTTGLEAITFAGPDVFEQNVRVTSGPLAGEYLWSNAANWSRGLPVNNDTVVFANPSGYSDDDITSLTLNGLTLGAGGHVYVEGGSNLTVANLAGATGSELFPDSADNGSTAPSSVTVGTITGTGALYAAKGTGASFIDQSASDAGETYEASIGGVVELAAAPADASSLDYIGVATFALQHPSASTAASLQGVAPGDVLELPGTSVSAVTFDPHSLSVTTDAGIYAFTNVTYANPVTGYTAALDPTTGLEAITFTGPDVFEQNVKATSGPLAGKFLWSNAANWSQGHAPVDGDSVAVADQTASGYDDLAALALNSLNLNGSDVYVTGSSLTIGALTGGAHLSAGGTTFFGTLHADALDAGAPVTVTVGTITDSYAPAHDEYLAVGTGAVFVDQSAVDAGEDYLAPIGGAVLELDATPAGTSRFFYTGNGEFAFAPGVGAFAFENPGASVAALLEGVAPGDVLELPGTSVNAVAFGAHSLSVTTDAGSYNFTNVNYLNPVTGYTAAHDPTTGLKTITFTGPDVFEQNVKATSGPLSGYYLWSSPANWSNGIPVNGDSVVIGSNENFAVDDLSALTLSTLTADGNSQLFVVGTSLTVATASLGSLVVGLLTSDAATVTLGTVTDAVAFFSDGANSRLIDQSAVEASAFNRVYDGGFAEFSGPLSASYPLSFYGLGTLAFTNAGASNTAELSGVSPGDVLELPGATVLSASFGAHSLSVTTDAGTYAFTNVTYSTQVTGYTAALDPTTGLEAITFTGVDVFEANVKATSGKFAGDYLWSNPANWSEGHAPIDGDSVAVRDIGATSYDDLASLTLTSLDMNYSTANVTGQSLTVGTVTGGGIFTNPAHFSFLTADAVDAGAPVTVTVGTIAGSRGTYQAVGAGASFVDQSATDASDTYEVGQGGSLTMSATPDSASDFDYYSDGTPSKLILEHPATVAGADFNYIVPGDVLELPGTSVSNVTFGANSLNVTTDAGSYAFFVLNHDATKPVTDYTAAFDYTTGLEAITFTGPDLFEANVKATNGPLAGQYLWSNAANWSNGVPIDGDSVVVRDIGATGYDDLASLTLTSLDMNYSTVNVTGQSLTVGTVTGGGIFTNPAHFSFLTADAADAGAPVTVTVGTITGSRGTYQAVGTGASFVDHSAIDASNTYEVGHGGSLTMAATPDGASDFDYYSDGTPSKLILEHPATVAGADFNYIVPGDVLELPGTSVSSVTFGANSLNVTTDAGSYAFFVLNHDATKPVTGYTDAIDPTTGLMAITFTGTGPAPPALSLLHDTGISANDHITNDPTLSYALSDNADTFRFSVDGSGFSAVAPNFAAHPLADGVHTVAVEEVDPVGNVSPASHLDFTLDTASPHWTGLTASPGSGSAFAGTTVQLTLDFNEAVAVTGGTPSLTLNDGGTALYDAAATALLGDSSKLVFDHLVTSSTPSTTSLAVTGLEAHGSAISDIAGNNADLSHVTAAFGALAINESFAPAYAVGGLIRPQLELDATGHIILDAAASAFADTYGLKSLYLGLPASTPYPPVPDVSQDFHLI